MACTVVVGGQYGSEGKGKVVALIAALAKEPWVVRCGGPNSGHTTNIHGKEVVLRQLPAAAGHPNAMLFVSAGCAVSEEIVLKEFDLCGLAKEQVIVDPRPVLVLAADIDAEQALAESIGSTASGTGSALGRRLLRQSDVRLVGDSEILHERVTVASVAPILHDCLDHGRQVIIEGTQGFGLSLLHGPFFPHVTSRDTTAAGFAMETGISPRQVNEIVLVIRTFPIRVGGASGPLRDEISWEEIQQLSQAPTCLSSTLRLHTAFGELAVSTGNWQEWPAGTTVPPPWPSWDWTG